jgi:hypothetical protein
MEEKKHKKLSASGSHRWFHCPGSIALSETVPPAKTSVFAEEGTGAHGLAEKVLKETPNAFYYVGREKFNGFEVTEEMAGAVQIYVDHVRNIKNETKGELVIEAKFDLPHIHEDIGGTADAVIKQDFGDIHVIDFKFGAGIAVEVENNSQAMIYALGAALGGEYEDVYIHIVQPRAFHPDGPIRTWKISFNDLIEWSKLLKQAAIKTEEKDAPLNAGEWCQFCPAKSVCPKLYEKAIVEAKIDFDNAKLPDTATMTDEHIAKVIGAKKLIVQWIEAVEDMAKMRLENGETIEGIKLVNKRTSREWVDERLAERELYKKFGETVYKKSFVSVTQAEKLFGANDLSNLYHSVSSGNTVAPESDRRKAIKAAKHDFETVNEDDF